MVFPLSISIPLPAVNASCFPLQVDLSLEVTCIVVSAVCAVTADVSAFPLTAAAISSVTADVSAFVLIAFCMVGIVSVTKALVVAVKPSICWFA